MAVLCPKRLSRRFARRVFFSLFYVVKYPTSSVRSTCTNFQQQHNAQTAPSPCVSPLAVSCFAAWLELLAQDYRYYSTPCKLHRKILVQWASAILTSTYCTLSRPPYSWSSQVHLPWAPGEVWASCIPPGERGEENRGTGSTNQRRKNTSSWFM